MKYILSKTMRFAILLIAVSFSLTANSSDSSFSKDAQSIDSIINAYYRVVSGPKGFKYNPAIDNFLHAQDAIITRFNEAGEFQRHTLLDEQKPLQAPYSEGFYEVEVNRVVESYGGLAHVWSTYEMRGSPKAKAFMRGINSISLHFKDNRWWISSWSTQYEGEDKIPSKYLPKTN